MKQANPTPGRPKGSNHVKPQNKRDKFVCVTCSDEDLKLIARKQKKIGIKRRSEFIRYAIEMLNV